jgi:nucleoside-diphosphate-sugar epimerase
MAILNTSRILVTGGTGFLGAYIIKELVRQGFYVRAIRRNNKLPFFIPAGILDQVEWIEGDILDIISLQEAMDGIDGVIHSAGKVSFVNGERISMYATNIQGTANMVNTSLELGIKKFIYISSVAAIGRTKNGELIDEGNQWAEFKPATHYAASKYHAEMEVWRAMAEGLDAVIVNPSTVLGYGDWNMTSCAIFKSVYNEFPWYTNGINGFVDVDDIARSSVLLLQSDISSERFLLSSDNWSFHRLFNAIADGFSKKHPWREATPFLGGLAWRLEKLKSWITGRPTILTRETAKIAHSSTRFDNSKILHRLPGFQFTPLQESIPKICLSYLENRQPA